MAVGVIWTDSGQSFAIDQLDKNTAIAAASFSYYGAWGSGSTTPAVGDTALVSENPEARVVIAAGGMSQPAADTVKWTYTMVAAGTIVVQETAIFRASVGPPMDARIVHGSLAFGVGDQVVYNVSLRLKDTTEA